MGPTFSRMTDLLRRIELENDETKTVKDATRHVAPIKSTPNIAACSSSYFNNNNIINNNKIIATNLTQTNLLGKYSTHTSCI